MNFAHKSILRSLLIPAMIAGMLVPVGLQTASAATVASMSKAYDESEATRDAMIRGQAGGFGASGAIMSQPQFGEAYDGRSRGACPAIHLDDVAGRC